MKILIIVFLAALAGLIAVQVNGQDVQVQYSTRSKKAIKLFESSNDLIKTRQYPEAAAMLEEALKKDSNFLEAHLRIAFCYKVINNLKAQKYHLQRVTRITAEPLKYKNVYYSLGEVCFLTGDYEAAKKNIEYFLELEKTDPRLIAEARKIYTNAEFASEHIKNPVVFKPEKLPEVINAGPLQYFPVLTVDEEKIFFTTRAGNSPGFDEDIYISQKDQFGNWIIPRPISRYINTGYNEGTCTISADGKILIFTSCQGRRGFGSCDLFISYNYGQDWTVPVNLGENINSPSWDSQPSLSADGRKLFFVSDRPGGVGKRDLWVSYLNENGKWEPAVNLGPRLNTSEDDVSPFIHVNGQTLYYATKGLPGFGGYDLYSTDYMHGNWTEPRNLGYPVNTADDQVSLFVTANGKSAYYSLDTYTIDGYPISSIYRFDIPEEISVSRKSLYVKGRVYDKETKKPLSARIELLDLNLDSLSGRVYSDSLFGEYIMVLTEGYEYALYVDRTGYLFESKYFDLIEKNRLEPVIMDFPLSKIKTGSNTVLNNIFFDLDKYELKDKSIPELRKVIDFMNDNPAVKILISGHTDDTGTPEYNKQLSLKRAQAVYDFLSTNKIPVTRILFIGYGQEKPAFPNDTEENRARNRRIEFEVVD